MVAINLEVLPMTNGIITLDSLQIDVKEKGSDFIEFSIIYLVSLLPFVLRESFHLGVTGRTYKPKHALKIAAASTIAPPL